MVRGGTLSREERLRTVIGLYFMRLFQCLRKGGGEASSFLGQKKPKIFKFTFHVVNGWRQNGMVMCNDRNMLLIFIMPKHILEISKHGPKYHVSLL